MLNIRNAISDVTVEIRDLLCTAIIIASQPASHLILSLSLDAP